MALAPPSPSKAGRTWAPCREAVSLRCNVMQCNGMQCNGMQKQCSQLHKQTCRDVVACSAKSSCLHGGKLVSGKQLLQKGASPVPLLSFSSSSFHSGLNPPPPCPSRFAALPLPEPDQSSVPHSEKHCSKFGIAKKVVVGKCLL